MKGRIVYLKFISLKSNKFVSINEDGSMYICKQNSKKEFVVKQKIQIDPLSVKCADLSSQWLAFGSSEDLVIWKVKRKEWNHMQTFRDYNTVLSVSLDYSYKKLISGEQNKQISIFQLNENDKKWIICQQIQVMSQVFRIKLLEEQFMLYEPQFNICTIYKLNGGKFEKQNEKDLQGNGNMTEQYPLYHSRHGFVVKHSNYLSFLNYSKINKNCQLNLQVYFENDKFYGCLSNAEEYLIIWDNVVKELQVRQWMSMID